MNDKVNAIKKEVFNAKWGKTVAGEMQTAKKTIGTKTVRVADERIDGAEKFGCVLSLLNERIFHFFFRYCKTDVIFFTLIDRCQIGV